MPAELIYVEEDGPITAKWLLFHGAAKTQHGYRMSMGYEMYGEEQAFYIAKRDGKWFAVGINGLNAKNDRPIPMKGIDDVAHITNALRHRDYALNPECHREFNSPHFHNLASLPYLLVHVLGDGDSIRVAAAEVEQVRKVIASLGSVQDRFSVESDENAKWWIRLAESNVATA